MIPTSDTFKRNTGRATVWRIFHKKNDVHINQIIKDLRAYEPLRGVASKPAIKVLRSIRRECIAWIAANPEDLPRASRPYIIDLALRANIVITDMVEEYYQGPSLNEKLRRAVGRMDIGKDRVGKQVGARYKSEWDGLHWGTHQHGTNFDDLTTAALRRKWEASRSKMPFQLWVEHILIPRSEDDPTGIFFKGNFALGDTLLGVSATNMRKNMVKFLTERERRDYALSLRGGTFYEASGSAFSTSGTQTAFSGRGWAIYVIGLNDTWYAGSHKVNRFHHSSFFAGGRVQAAGEIQVGDDGKLTKITNKTGHYRAGSAELTRALFLLHRGGVDLTKVQAGIVDATHTQPAFFNAMKALRGGCDRAALLK